MKKILILSPHQDDETLGCGGTILNHKRLKDKIFCLNFTEMKQNDSYSPKQIKTRITEIKKIKNSYQFEEYINLGFPTRYLDSIPYNNLLGKVTNVINKIRPSIIYIPHGGDIHTDHKIVHSIGLNFTKSFRFKFVDKILAYETISETNFNFSRKNIFNPNVFIDISRFIKKKISISKIYKSEISKHPHPRSEQAIKSLALLRGSQSGKIFAEAFELIKETQ
jgi:N-acetylglucosamine malate deacetylase 1